MIVKKRVPWTELFRPRVLDEVILTRKQRKQILTWWRNWIILWNINKIWNLEERSKWYEFARSDEGKIWINRYLRKWREFFSTQFEKWIKNKIGDIPEIHYTLFKPTDKKKDVSTDLKPTAVVEIKKWIDKIWGQFLSGVSEDIIPPTYPPIPPYKPILLVGPPGNGKTSTIYALAWQEGAVVIEFNASDQRNSRIIREVVAEATKSMGFTLGGDPHKPSRIILLDEVDGLSGKEDRGGFSALVKLLDEIRIPIALTANIMHDPKVKYLMLRSVTVFFDRPYDYQIKTLISRISKRIGKSFPENIVNYLARYAPDFRTVVEALETYYYTGVLPEIFHEEMMSIQDALRYAFALKGEDLDQSAFKAKKYLSSVVDVDVWDLILWVWENAHNFLDQAKRIYPFYSELAYADYLYKLGARSQNWRIAYRDALNVLAYSIAKYGKPSKNIWALRKIKVNKPTIVEELGRMKRLMEGDTEETETIGEISVRKLGLRPLIELYARYTHLSRQRARRELKFLLYLIENDPERMGRFFARLYVPKETIELFLRHFIKKKDEKSELSLKLMKAYQEELEKIGPRYISLKHEVPKHEEVKREREEKKEKKPTLDMFFEK